MHFRKKSLTQALLDEPYSNSDGAKIRREYGAKDNCLTGCVDRVALNNAIKDLPQGYRTIFVLSTKSRIRASGDCGDARLFGGEFEIAIA